MLINNSPEPSEPQTGGDDTQDTLSMFDAILADPEEQKDVETEADETEQDEAPDAETEEDPDGETDEEEADDEQPVEIELKHNGKTIKKTLDEVKDLAQQGFDYSQKLHRVNADREEVSLQRQAIQAQQTQLATQQQTYLESLSVMEKFLSSGGIPEEALDKALADGDNDTYLRLKNQRDKDARNLNNIRAAIKQEQENISARDRAYFEEQRSKGKEVLAEKMPHLLENKGAQELYNYLNTYGYTPDQINSTVDPNLYIMAEKARQYDALMSKANAKPPVQKPVPKALKSKASPAPADAAKQAQYTKTMQRVKSGDRTAAVDAFAFFV